MNLNKNKKDGAYPALNGYYYQFNKTIMQILNNESNVYFEYLEDINTEAEITQVKQWNKKYTKSLIKDAIINLYDTFTGNKGMIPVLFGFVVENDKTELQMKIDIEDILKEKDIVNYNDFLSKIVVDLHPENSKEKEYKEVITKIKENFQTDSQDISENYYCNIITSILQTIVNNKNIKKRYLNKISLIKSLKEKTKNCFNSLFCEFKTEDKYIKYIKKEYISERNPSNQERLFIVDLYVDDLNMLTDLCNSIIKKYNQHIDFKNRKQQYIGYLAIEKSIFYSPYIFFKNIDKNLLLELKNNLTVKKPYNIIDGFQFKNSKFNKEYFFEENPFCNLKFINNEKILNEFLSHTFLKPKKIFYFYDKQNNYKDKEDIIKIYVKDLNFINKII
jgi:hypothetical protein